MLAHLPPCRETYPCMLTAAKTKKDDVISKRHIHINLLVALIICMSIPARADGFILNEVPLPGTAITKVVVQWSGPNGQPIPGLSPTVFEQPTGVRFPSIIPFDTNKIFVPDGTPIKDWTQTRTAWALDGAGQLGRQLPDSPLHGTFAAPDNSSARDPLIILSYEDAYSILGLTPGDNLFLPNFNADLNHDGFAETQLFSAINMFDLALKFPQFVNNQPFNAGQSYLASNFMAFGFVFSLSDNIQFDFDGVGFFTTTPLSPDTSIIADTMHVTGFVPAPVIGSGLSGVLAACVGLLLLGWWRRRQKIGLTLGGTHMSSAAASLGVHA
jgi:hypothetical protein